MVLVPTNKITLNESPHISLTSISVYNKSWTGNCKSTTTLILIIKGFIAVILHNPT